MWFWIWLMSRGGVRKVRVVERPKPVTDPRLVTAGWWFIVGGTILLVVVGAVWGP